MPAFQSVNDKYENKKEISILIIYTGGTIGMVHDPETGSLVPIDFKHISDHVPELRNLVMIFTLFHLIL